jgi:hypothetical protein
VSRELDRRTLLRAAAACVALTACSPAAPPRAEGAPTPAASPPGPVLAPLPPALPVVPRWTPLPGEPLPDLKQAAADFAQLLSSRAAGATPDDALAAAVAAAPAPALDAAQALEVAAPLFEEPTSTGEVVYPQFGGLVPDGPDALTASVMVVLRQQVLTSAGTASTVERTLDVRLTRVDGQWQVTGLPSVGGEPVARPDGLDPLAAAVLDDPRIDLPDSARWDVHAGRVTPGVLRVLADAAARAPLSVCVLQSGHPVTVFGTDRTSDHTRGRAVDVWAVGGAPVLGQPLTGSPMSAVLDGAFADPGVRQVGSPPGTDRDGPAARRSFTNLVHADHLHLATGGEPPGPA